MPQPQQPQIPSRISSRGVGRGAVSVGWHSRGSNYGDQEDPMDAKLRRLALLDQMDQSEQASNSGRLGDLAKTMTEVTGLQDKMDLTPAHIALLKANADYYGAHAKYLNQTSEGRPEERAARAMELELTGLDKAYAYDPNNPEYHNAKRSVLQKYGYNLDTAAPTGPKPQDAMGGADITKKLGATQPSKLASLGSALTEDYTGAHNAVGVPLYNAMAEGTNKLRSLVGLSPNFESAKPMPSNMPADYNFWFPQRRKQQPQPQPTLESQ